MGTIVIILYLHKTNERFDLEIPVNITAKELLTALNQAYKLGIDMDDLSHCYLTSENPIALLKGNKTMEQYKLRNGSSIHVN